MADFEVTIVGIIQFIGKNEVDDFTGEILTSVDTSAPKIRYVFLCIDKDNSCKVKIYQYGRDPCEILLKDKNFYTTDQEKGALPFFFSEYVLKDKGKHVQSTRYFMITIGHGAGFGIMTTNTILKERFLSIPQKEKFLETTTLTKFFEQTLLPAKENTERMLVFAANNLKINDYSIPDLNDFKIINQTGLINKEEFNTFIRQHRKALPSMKYLTSFQFAEIIETAFQKYRVQTTDNVCFDLIIQVNCYMQSIENGYALRNVTKYLCSTEVGFPQYGLSYKQLFKKLISDPSISVEEFFETVKGALYAQKQGQLSTNNPDKGNISLSLNRLKCYKQISKQLSALSELFIKYFALPLPIEEQELKKFNLCCHFYKVRDNGRFLESGATIIHDDFCFLDLSNILTDLTLSLGNKIPSDLKKELKKVISMSGNTVVGKPLSTYPEDSPKYPKSFGILFPRRNRIIGTRSEATLKELLEYYYNSRFSINQKWDDFIKEYLKEEIDLENKCDLKSP